MCLQIFYGLLERARGTESEEGDAREWSAFETKGGRIMSSGDSSTVGGGRVEIEDGGVKQAKTSASTTTEKSLSIGQRFEG